jgi:hypothetical protein
VQRLHITPLCFSLAGNILFDLLMCVHIKFCGSTLSLHYSLKLELCNDNRLCLQA